MARFIGGRSEICTGAREDAVVLDKSHLLIEASAEQAVSLTKMTEITGVNALVSDQELSFGAKGITIIYGDNGSGKSGYCRVLKHACRSRDQKFSIYPDRGGCGNLNSRDKWIFCATAA
jgi:energy-coupling factor transporter ATP-binding protein EcfA2